MALQSLLPAIVNRFRPLPETLMHLTCVKATKRTLT